MNEMDRREFIRKVYQIGGLAALYGMGIQPRLAHSAVISSGSVTRANLRLSTVNGLAFVDFSAAGALTPYIGCRLTIIDSTGDTLVAWISEEGTGETLGEELNVNGDFAAGNANWTRSNVDCATGQAIFSGDAATLSQDIGATIGRLYRQQYTIASSNHTDLFYSASGFTGSRAISKAVGTHTYYLTAVDSDPLFYVAFGAGFQTVMDDVSTKQVTAPSATGVWLVSAQGGATRNCTSIGASFTLNDPGNYSYRIERFGAAGLLGW